MGIKERYAAFKKRRLRKKAERMIMKSRSVTRAKIAYWYVIMSGVISFMYGISCMFHDYPVWWAFVLPSLFVVFLVVSFLYRNFRMIMVFLTSSERGALLHVLNETTQWGYEHKMMVVKWVYPKGEIRRERAAYLMNSVHQGDELSDSEKRELKKKRVFCPQQLLDGINKAILVNALIYANTRIKPLDKGLKEILELTEENISKFDFQREINKCKREEDEKKIKEYTKIGMKKIRKNAT